MTVSDERVKELAQEHYSQSYEDGLSCGQVEHLRKLRNKDTADALCELLALRAEVKEWREDSDRFAEYAEHLYDGCTFPGRGCICGLEACRAQHSALVEKYSVAHGKA